MKSKLKTIACASLVVFLIACGGGGGSSSAAQTASSVDTFQFRAANAASTQDTSTLAFNLTGVSNGIAITGSGTISKSAITSTFFEGISALAITSTTNATFTGNGITFPLTATDTSYSDSSYLPLGSSGSEYVVLSGTANIPNTVVVGDSGTIGVANRYSNSTKATFLGTYTSTYAIAPDTEHTALLKLTYVYRDTNSVTTQTNVTTIRITPAGGTSYLSSVANYTNGNVFTFTFR